MAKVHPPRQELASSVAMFRKLTQERALGTLRRAMVEAGATRLEARFPGFQGLVHGPVRMLDADDRPLAPRGEEARFTIERVFVDDTPGLPPCIDVQEEVVGFEGLVAKVMSGAVTPEQAAWPTNLGLVIVPLEGEVLAGAATAVIGSSTIQVAAPFFEERQNFPLGIPGAQAKHDAYMDRSAEWVARVNRETLGEVLGLMDATHVEVEFTGARRPAGQKDVSFWSNEARLRPMAQPVGVLNRWSVTEGDDATVVTSLWTETASLLALVVSYDRLRNRLGQDPSAYQGLVTLRRDGTCGLGRDPVAPAADDGPSL